MIKYHQVQLLIGKSLKGLKQTNSFFQPLLRGLPQFTDLIVYPSLRFLSFLVAGPVLFPPGPPPNNADTSGVIVGASGFGFVPPNAGKPLGG